MSWRLGLSALILVASASWCANGTAAGATEAGSDPYGSVGAMLGPMVVVGKGYVQSRTTRFDLGRGAAQGSTKWYVLDARVKIYLARAVRPGAAAEVDILTDGHAAAEINVTGDVRAGRPETWWSTYDLLVGASTGVALGRSIRLHYRNYLQVRGVRPGENTLTVRVWQFGGRVVRSVEFLRGSHIAWGALGPPRLGVTAYLSAVRTFVGDTVMLRYRIGSSGYPAQGVGVAVEVSGPGLMISGVPYSFLGWVSSQEETRRLIALIPGTYWLTVQVSSATAASVTSRQMLVVYGSSSRPPDK